MRKVGHLNQTGKPSLVASSRRTTSPGPESLSGLHTRGPWNPENGTAGSQLRPSIAPPRLSQRIQPGLNLQMGLLKVSCARSENKPQAVAEITAWAAVVID